MNINAPLSIRRRMGLEIFRRLENERTEEHQLINKHSYMRLEELKDFLIRTDLHVFMEFIRSILVRDF